MVYIIYVGYTLLLGRRVTSEEFSRCYGDVNICLWTDGSELTQSAAQTACQQRNSFLPRVTNSDIQSKLADFRSYANTELSEYGFWIDVRRDNAAFHWIDGSQLAGLLHAYMDNCYRVTLMNFSSQAFVESQISHIYLPYSLLQQLEFGSMCHRALS